MIKFKFSNDFISTLFSDDYLVNFRRQNGRDFGTGYVAVLGYNDNAELPYGTSRFGCRQGFLMTIQGMLGNKRHELTKSRLKYLTIIRMIPNSRVGKTKQLLWEYAGIPVDIYPYDRVKGWSVAIIGIPMKLIKTNPMAVHALMSDSQKLAGWSHNSDEAIMDVYKQVTEKYKVKEIVCEDMRRAKRMGDSWYYINTGRFTAVRMAAVGAGCWKEIE